MPDPFTHVSLAYLLGRATRQGRLVAVFVLGTFLPDALTAAPTLVIPDSYWFWAPAHTPVGVVLWAYALALFFRREERRGVFLALVGGGWLAIALDLFQDHISGGYMLLFPFFWREYEFHVFAPEASLYAAPFLAGAIAAVELVVRWRRRHPPRPLLP
jgi:hypothetical protein